MPAQPPSQSSPFKAWIPVVSVIILLGAACGEKMPDLVKRPYAEEWPLDSTAFVITRVDTLADTIDYGRGVIVSQSIPAGEQLERRLQCVDTHRPGGLRRRPGSDRIG
jgi:hypothetical protein